MNITVYNPKDREKKYTLRYRPTFENVLEGRFLFDKDGIQIHLTEQQMYDALTIGVATILNR